MGMGTWEWGRVEVEVEGEVEVEVEVEIEEEEKEKRRTKRRLSRHLDASTFSAPSAGARTWACGSRMPTLRESNVQRTPRAAVR